MRLAVVTSTDIGAQDFIDAVWPNGELWVDDSEEIKKSLGGPKYQSWWLLKPSVLKNLVKYARAGGSAMDDISHKNTQTLGGTFVVVGGEVVYSHRETSSFDNGDAKLLLAAALRKDVADLTDISTPAQEAAVCVRK